tara:strand:+ start:230 stop:793 length:564 start_codon:yes stop_codon:yes gene_type:complete
MGTAFYVFENEEEYDKMYKERIKETVHHSKVLEMYLKPDKIKEGHLWVITQSSKQKERPRMERSIVHFRNGLQGVTSYKEGDEISLEKKDVKFNKKKMRVEILPKTLRKSILEFRVDRYYGEEVKGRIKSDEQKYYYDTVMDRINIVLKPKATKIDLKQSHKDFPRKTQVFTYGHMNPSGVESSSSN